MASPRFAAGVILASLGLPACDSAKDPQTAAARAVDPTTLRFYLTEDEAASIFGLSSAKQEYDPFTYTRREAHSSVRYPWPEHPDGQFFIEANGSGLRDDEEVATSQPDLRILVTGDSHTDGVCANDESFANVLERLLREEDPTRTVETLNAAYGGYGFYQYLGVLQKFLPLEPDVFVVGVYGGNDLVESLVLTHHFARTRRPTGGPEYMQPVKRLLGEILVTGRATFNQDFNQRYYFQTFPDQVQVAIEDTLARLDDLRALCDEYGIRLIVLYIPPPFDVQPERFEGLFERAGEMLGLSEESYALNDNLGTRLLRTLDERGVETLDAREVFREPARETLLYWRRDHHLNLEGHRLLAEALRERLAHQ